MAIMTKSSKLHQHPSSSSLSLGHLLLHDVDDSLEAKALDVHRRLCTEYGCPVSHFHTLEPLDELVSAMLSHRTRNRDSAQAFRALRARFRNWSEVRDAPTAAVEASIAACTWPEQKAPGPKTSAAVISFSTMRGKALPVDSHHHRVAVRVGLIPEGLAVGPAHRVLEAQLPADWDAQLVYDNHQVIMRHGKQVCTWRDPQCRRCVLLDLCPHGQAREEVGHDANAGPAAP
jgi:endonuclease-3